MIFCNLSQSSLNLSSQSLSHSIVSLSLLLYTYLYCDTKFPHQKTHLYRGSFKGHYAYILYSCSHFWYLFVCLLVKEKIHLHFQKTY